MSAFGSRRNAVHELLALTGLYVRTRHILREHVQAEGKLPTDEVQFLAERTLPHVEAMQQGFRWSVRASEAEVDELRFVVSPLLPLADGEADTRAHRALDRPELAYVAAYSHGRVVMGLVPRLPPELTTFPDGLSYRDIWPPRGPGELKNRLEELERGIWEIASGSPSDAIYHGLHRRVYGFFEAGAWLGLQQVRGLGFRA